MTESGGARSGGRVGDVFFLIFSGAMEEGGGVERGEGVDERTRQGACTVGAISHDRKSTHPPPHRPAYKEKDRFKALVRMRRSHGPN